MQGRGTGDASGTQNTTFVIVYRFVYLGACSVTLNQWPNNPSPALNKVCNACLTLILDLHTLDQILPSN